jgi:hypothetical protein
LRVEETVLVAGFVGPRLVLQALRNVTASRKGKGKVAGVGKRGMRDAAMDGKNGKEKGEKTGPGHGQDRRSCLC